MKKGRHRRFEEARNLKRSWDGESIDVVSEENVVSTAECDECGAALGTPHASWCLAEDIEEATDESFTHKSSADKYL